MKSWRLRTNTQLKREKTIESPDGVLRRLSGLMIGLGPSFFDGIRRSWGARGGLGWYEGAGRNTGQESLSTPPGSAVYVMW